MTATGQIGPMSPMREVLEVFPGVQRAFFRRYHIGGCAVAGLESRLLEQIPRVRLMP